GHRSASADARAGDSEEAFCRVERSSGGRSRTDRTLSPGRGPDCPPAQHRTGLSNGAQRGPRRGTVRVSSPRPPLGRTFAKVASGIGLLHRRVLVFRSAVAAQKLGQVLGEGGTRQNHVASHFVSFLLQIALHMREKSNDRGSLLELRL